MSKKNPFKRLIERSIRSAVYSAFGIKPNKNRRIPREIKNEVHKRDGGRCVICGSNVNFSVPLSNTSLVASVSVDILN